MTSLPSKADSFFLVALTKKNPSLLKYTIAAQLHLAAGVLALIGTVVLVYFCLQKSAATNQLAACLVYGITGILVFSASATYHFICDGFHVSPELRKWLKDLDHFGIFLFIAGGYTVFIVNAVANPWANRMLVLVWVLATAGILYTHYKPRLPAWARHRWVNTLLFIAMGWIAVFRLQEIVSVLTPQVFTLLLLGGLSYSIGAVIYATKRPHLFVGVFGYHELWHVAVIFGFAFHYFTILSFYI